MLVSFDVDLADPVQLAFAKWHEQNPAGVKEAALLGHYVIANGVERFYKNFYEVNIVEVKEREWQDRMRVAVASSAAAHESQVVHLKDRVRDLEAQACNARDAVEQEVERHSAAFKQQVHELQGTLASMVKDGQVEQLRTAIAERDAELKVLKSSNHVKGVTGEKIIMKHIERHFPELGISHTVFKAAEADVHVTNAAGDLIIVESKYKERITGGDVDKFYRDIGEVSRTKRCVGAVFVSVVNRSIPNKGSLCIERRNGVPVMFAAFEGEAELEEHLAPYMRLFMGVCTSFRAGEERDGGSNDELLTQLAQAFALVDKNKVKLAGIRESCIAPLDRALKDIGDNNSKVLGVMEGILEKHGRAGTGFAQAVRIVCKDCGQEFKRQGDLTRHVAKKHRAE